MPVETSRPSPSSAGSGLVPSMLFVQGNSQRVVFLAHTPFTIGRKQDRDLVIADPLVSREHATIISENGDYYVVDQGSKLGTFLNGEKVERHKLKPNDRLEFGVRDSAYAIFKPTSSGTNEAREFLSQISQIKVPNASNDLEKLILFLEAARKLNTAGVLDEVLVTLIDATLRLTHAERGFIFLKDKSGSFVLAAGRTQKGEPITDDKTISHSILQEALKANSEFLVTDTSASEDLSLRQSIVAFDLRTVICIPLLRPQVHTTRPAEASPDEVMGALYVDSRLISRELSNVSHDILRAIATEAASLIENANLVQAEEANRRYEQEIAIAATIQQRLMAVALPDVSFALVDGRNLACKDVGGDFYDWVNTPEGLALVICDVSGKGIAAAILASTLQGMVYSQLIAGIGLQDIVAAVNRFFHDKNIAEKYATMILARVKPNGDLEYANCGHIQPLIISGGATTRLTHGNVPVGLIPGADFSSAHHQLKPGDRLVLVSDGVTEAENATGDFFDNEGLDAAALCGPGINLIFNAIDSFCGSTPLNDDCTVVELTYLG